MTMLTLTRSQAHALVDDCGDDMDALYALARHWIGHTENISPELMAALLHEYVDECATPDDERERGPRNDDDTGLTDPDAALAGLSDALINWQVSQGLPQQCAEEQLATCRALTLAQRLWLKSFVALWDLTNV